MATVALPLVASFTSANAGEVDIVDIKGKQAQAIFYAIDDKTEFKTKENAGLTTATRQAGGLICDKAKDNSGISFTCYNGKFTDEDKFGLLDSKSERQSKNTKYTDVFDRSGNGWICSKIIHKAEGPQKPEVTFHCDLNRK